MGLCNGTWHREKEQRRKVSAIPVHFVQGNVLVASFFVSLNFSAGPGWVWRAGEQRLLRGPPGRPRSSAGACSSARCQQPLRKGSCWRAVLPGAFVALLIARIVVGLSRVPARTVGGQARGGGERSRSRGVSLDAGVLCSLLPSSFFGPSNLERKQELDFCRVLGGGTYPLPRLVNPTPVRAAEAGPAALLVPLPGASRSVPCSLAAALGVPLAHAVGE